jgi:hypothetical protein
VSIASRQGGVPEISGHRALDYDPARTKHSRALLALATFVSLRKGQLVGETRWGLRRAEYRRGQGRAREGAVLVELKCGVGGRGNPAPWALRACVRTGPVVPIPHAVGRLHGNPTPGPGVPPRPQ